ncbi:hypothetical protein ACIHFE_09120 [Streptomyces sp. NPDC052396]|uniref:hypothetical protein n=1 Tax=Streptomyces sp. NPDC052396 TaxID=3365689 RepID=UPI0037D6ABA1
MTTPPSDALLFEVPAPLTPIERLLVLADQYTRHNDAIDYPNLSSPRAPIRARTPTPRSAWPTRP